ncbi:MAG: phosphatidylserine decarboxylase [Gammaproteobacteria bacterium]|nr:phosphatidylserine decarboxylase [Gammaproteobacteria bacterium]MYH47822.1 phosphatidylserine decarboxylase [Gammaproteobacteria bacterium]MYL12819.1 phosphatidylserine decarboxylase [Gammaproteobacteria bacterium]
MRRLFVLLQYLLPQRLLTSAAGALARNEAMAGLLIRLFISRYQVDMNEALDPDPASYRSFNEFFTRHLKAGARPLAKEEDAVLCPADGALSQFGAIGKTLVQAKGVEFSTAALLGANEKLARELQGGRFMTIYLSPRDYHRVHMPLVGKLSRTRYIPGKLFSVNEASTDSIPGLFSRNERLVCEFMWERGHFAVVMVGAMIVAGIRTIWDSPGARQTLEQCFTGKQPILAAGAEMGRFELGSTVILLFPPGTMEFEPGLAPGDRLEMGRKIGRLLPKV